MNLTAVTLHSWRPPRVILSPAKNTLVNQRLATLALAVRRLTNHFEAHRIPVAPIAISIRHDFQPEGTLALPSRSISLPKYRQVPCSRSIILNLVELELRSLPERFELLDRALRRLSSLGFKSTLDNGKPSLDAVEGSVEGDLSIDAEVSTKVDDREQHITELTLHGTGFAGRQSFVELSKLLIDLGSRPLQVTPIKTHSRPILAKLETSTKRRLSANVRTTSLSTPLHASLLTTSPLR